MLVIFVKSFLGDMFSTLYSSDFEFRNVYKLWDILFLEKYQMFHSVGLAICRHFESKIRACTNQITSELNKRKVPTSLEFNCIVSTRVRTLITSLEINKAFSKIYSLMTSSKVRSISSFLLGNGEVFSEITKKAKQSEAYEYSKRVDLLIALKNHVSAAGISLQKASMQNFIDELKSHIGDVKLQRQFLILKSL